MLMTNQQLSILLLRTKFRPKIRVRGHHQDRKGLDRSLGQELVKVQAQDKPKS